jgi:inorganic pyrophosphatase
MIDLNLVETRDAKTGCVNVIVDTPRGSRSKFKFDEQTGLFRLSRILPVGMAFPFDFGSIPRTRAEDGDPLDALVVSDVPSFCGCLVTMRLVGVLRARQHQAGSPVQNDRLIGVPVTSVNDPPERDIYDLPPRTLEEISSFFVTYNRVHGREFVSEGWHGREAAEAVLESAIHSLAASQQTK